MPALGSDDLASMRTAERIVRWGGWPPGAFASLGFLLGVLYWLLDAAVHAFVFHEGGFYHTAFSPDIVHLWMRLTTVALLVVAGVLADAIMAQRRRAEAELRKSEQQLRSLVESSGVGILAYDTHPRYTLWNPAMEKISGLRAEDLLGRPVSEVFPFLDEVGELEAMRKATRGEASVLSVMPYDIPESGRSGYFESSHFPLYDAQGCVVGGMGVIQDVTERTRAEQALRESEGRYQDLYDNAPDMFVSVDARTATISWCNQTLARVLGFTREELLGRPVFDIYHPDGMDAVKEALQSFLSTGKVQGAELRLRRRDGTSIDVSLNASAVRDERGAIQYSRSILRDISERKRAECEQRKLDARLQQAQKSESLTLLAGGIAHDFNNVLVTILGNAELLLGDLPPGSAMRELVEEIKAASSHASDLCRQMLAYAGKARPVIERVHLENLLRETSQLLEASISKNTTLRYDIADDLPAIEADGTQIRQVLMNLVTNASEAIGERGGVISIATRAIKCDRADPELPRPREESCRDVCVCLEVSDTGCGMDETAMAKMFDPFFSTKFVGRGLGLAAVKGIVDAHRGVIAVDSELGRGTTFRIVFPGLDERAQSREAEPEAVQDWGGSGMILLVDDEGAVRKTVSRMLEKAGFSVLSASGGREATALYRERASEIACVLLDLTMPDMGGEETFRELRSIRGDVRVIVSSGYSEQEVASRFGVEEALEFIEKPYSSKQLIQKLREVLDPGDADGIIHENCGG